MTKTYLPQVDVKKKILSEVMIKNYLQVRKHYTRGISIQHLGYAKDPVI